MADVVILAKMQRKLREGEENCAGAVMPQPEEAPHRNEETHLDISSSAPASQYPTFPVQSIDADSLGQSRHSRRYSFNL